MDHKRVVQLTAIIATVSFFHTSQTLRRHSLTDHPRLSSCLVFLLSGVLCHSASFLVGLIPRSKVTRKSVSESRASGLLVEDPVSNDTLLKGSRAHLPPRPGRWTLPVLIIAVVARLEVFHRVTHQQHCATPGIESFLCLVLIAHEIFMSRGRWGWVAPEDPDDPWRSLFDDLWDWFSGIRGTMVLVLMSTFLFTFGTFLSLNTVKRSTYVCLEGVDSQKQVLLLQVGGLMLDSVVIVLVWRFLAWSRSYKLRLRTTGNILCLSSLLMALLGFGAKLYARSAYLSLSVGSLYGLDVVIDSVAFACLALSATQWMCGSSPIAPASIITFAIGIWNAGDSIIHTGDWLHLSPFHSLFHLYLICYGAVFFTYTHDLRDILFVKRWAFALVIAVGLVTATWRSLSWGPELFNKGHPIKQFTYDADIAHHRWLSRVSISTTLRVAVETYQETHQNRMPPPNFDAWWHFASTSLIRDQFSQIDRDLAVFWSKTPRTLRLAAEHMAKEPKVTSIIIKAGHVSHSQTGDSSETATLDTLCEMIGNFAKHLPDMTLPINLSPTPRILPSWDSTHENWSSAGSPYQYFQSPGEDDASERVLQRLNRLTGSRQTKSMQVSEYRRMLMDGCPLGSPVRRNRHWNVAEFCERCTEAHSYSSLLTDFDKALDVCAQPDLWYLHDFLLDMPAEMPYHELLPLFGPSKIDVFSDIVIPLPEPWALNPIPEKWTFQGKYDGLAWTPELNGQSISDQSIRGSQTFRLLHLLMKPDPEDQITMILPQIDVPQRYQSEVVQVSEANLIVPIGASISGLDGCTGINCDFAKEWYGSGGVQEAKGYRYLLETDSNEGPSPRFLRTLRTDSVPFLSTIFRTWYTDRITPWLHFVPVDPRYQGLHSTYAYFTGTVNRGAVNGRETQMEGRAHDAGYIASQGRKWAQKAMDKKHMEVYWFRLLLEWGRLIDDNREAIGLHAGGEGGFRSDSWSTIPDTE